MMTTTEDRMRAAFQRDHKLGFTERCIEVAATVADAMVSEAVTERDALELVLGDVMAIAANAKTSRTNPNTTFVDTRDWEAFVSRVRAVLARSEAKQAEGGAK